MTITTKSAPSDIIREAVAQEISQKKWYSTRKDTITNVSGYILQAAQIGAVYLTDAPLWLTIVIGTIIAIAQISIIAGTKGEVTPSMAGRLAQQVEKIPTNTPTERFANDQDSYREVLEARYAKN